MTATLTLTASRSDGAPHLSLHTIPSGTLTVYDREGNIVFCWDCEADAAVLPAAVPAAADFTAAYQQTLEGGLSLSSPEAGDRVYYPPEDRYGTVYEVTPHGHAATVDWSTGERTTVRLRLLERLSRG